jgi:hypothetical protein
MKYLGTKFTITLGELRLRFIVALDDGEDESRERQIRAVPDAPPGNRTFGR